MKLKFSSFQFWSCYLKIHKRSKWQLTFRISWNFLTTRATYVFHPIRSTPSGDPSFEATVPCRSPGPSRNISCFKVMLEEINTFMAFFPPLFPVLKVFMLILCLDFVLEVISDLHMFYGKKAGITTDGSTMDLNNFEIKICTTSMDVKWILVSSFSGCA